jgi:D-beta-D-heptose 7-phosphate kinase/D-beta-D-heptose 1-phosphate adenosyltransferase
MPISSIIKHFEEVNVLVIGDIMLDRYVWGRVKRISPEAPVPVLKVSDENLSLGGAANVAVNLKSLGAKVELYGVVGRDLEGEKLIDLLKQVEIKSEGIIFDPKRPTTTKTRLIAENQQIARVDREDTFPVSNDLEDELLNLLTKSTETQTPHGIIISDYAKGTINENLSAEIIKLAKQKGIFVAVDPKGGDFTKYKGASVITPNEREAEEICGFSIKDGKTLKKAFEILIEETDVDGLLITRGKQGISFYVKGGNVKTIPSEAREVFDVTGAGDTVISAFTLAFLSSNSWEDSVKIANLAAGIVVSRIGTATVTRGDLLSHFENNKYSLNDKILTEEVLSVIIPRLKANGKKIVFTNGCFDLFHIGHLKLLREAKKLGDMLIVGINTDDSVKRLKGEGRPLISENDRADLIAALDFVDYVVLFQEDNPSELIKAIKPDVLVKGSDYKPENIIGREFVESYGGRIYTIPIVEGISTTYLLNKIRNYT